MREPELLTLFAASQLARGLSPKTVRRRRFSLLKFADPTQVSVDELERVLAECGAAETKSAVVSDLRQFLRWCRRRDVQVFDPTDRIDPVRVPRRLPSPVSPADLERLLANAGPVTERLILLAAYAGLRVSEIAALEHNDVHHDTGVIVVRDGKGGRDDVVPLAPRLAAVLPREATGRVVPTLGSGDAVSNHLRRHMKRCGVAARPHDLRHTFGTEAARASAGDAYRVAQMMRHSNVSTSMRYVRLAGDGRDLIGRMFAA